MVRADRELGNDGDLSLLDRVELLVKSPGVPREVALVAEAERRGVRREKIVLDPGIGFSKTQKQNVELIAKLPVLAREFAEFPLLVGTSRKSFIGHLLGGAPVNKRIHGTMATVTAAVLGGAAIVRVHDVRAAVETVRVADAIKQYVDG